MKLQDQVIPIEQAKLLKSLGVNQSSVFYHIDNLVASIGYEGIKFVKTGIPKDGGCIRYYSAFTVAELGLMIGKGTNAASLLYDAVQARMNQSHSFTIVLSAQFVANCLIGMLETGRVTPEEVNAKLCAE